MKKIQCAHPPHHHNGFAATCRLWTVSGEFLFSLMYIYIIYTYIYIYIYIYILYIYIYIFIYIYTHTNIRTF